MSDLRERAAIAAMVGLIQNNPVKGVREQMQDVIASVAVKCADALLAELARTTSPVRPEPSPQPSVPNKVLNPGTKLYVFQDGQPKVTAEVHPELRCTAAERELIETSLYSQISNNFYPWYAAIEAVRAERRAASEAKGGVQP